VTLVSVPDERWLDLWDGPAPVELALWDVAGEVPGAADGGPEIVVPPYLGRDLPLARLAELPRLRVVQTLTAGVDDVLPFMPLGVTLCNATGVHDTSTAELTIGLTIAALRGLGDFARAQTTGTWLSSTRTSLADRRVLLIGAGSVGRAILDRLAAFEVSVTRVATTARVDDVGPVHGVGELAQLLRSHDVVILIVPLTPSTRGMVDAAFLAAMPDGALLVNVARGPVVDTEALVAEVSSGRLAAALDVTDPEPLPVDHPLWRAPNVLISPHVGGNSTAFVPRARALLRRQFEAYAAGEPLANVVR
jgi:phosphoglycerate dehydrogenase-like enzyme